MGVKSPNISDDVTARLQFAFQEESEYPVSVIQFMDGKSVSILKSDKRLRVWRLLYSEQTESEYQSLKTFWTARKGPYERFYFDHPFEAETDIPVRFDWRSDRAFESEWDSPTTRRVTLKIREVAE